MSVNSSASFITKTIYTRDEVRETIKRIKTEDAYRKKAFHNIDESYQGMKSLCDAVFTLDASLEAEFSECWQLFNTTFGDQVTTKEMTNPVQRHYISKDELLACHSEADIRRLMAAKANPVKLAEALICEGLLSHAVCVLRAANKNSNHLGDVDPKVKEWIRLRMEFVPVAEVELDSMALTCASEAAAVTGLGWGYKSANLTRLQALAEKISEECACSVSVPPFLPVSDMEMRSFILKHYPDLQSDWERFLASIPAEKKEAFEGAGKPFDLPEASLDILRHIGTRIETVFNAHVYDSPDIQEWIGRQDAEFLIIRSTGKEDSETNSNAGGNASIPFIEKNPGAISSAIGKVLSSYFCEKSVLQRISAGDKSLTSETYFLPVLVQSMVGEKVGGRDPSLETLPRSGVIFTAGSEMGAGISKCFIGLGNNEGIVSSRVATDCYILGPNGSGHRVLHDKSTRFVAVEKASAGDGARVFGCEPIPVDGAVAEARRMPSLDEMTARDLKRIADFYSARYSKTGTPMPLDMEVSIMGDQIYLLQARPLMQVDSGEPSYLKVEELPAANVRKATTLVDGGCNVRVINSANQVIVVDRIDEALDTYLHGSGDQEQIRTVIIREPAPGTSHEAVTLRSKGVAVMVVTDELEFNELKLMRSGLSPTSMLTVDPGRGYIAKTKTDVSSLIQEGYFCYPTPLEMSLRPTVLVESLYKLREIKSRTGAEVETQRAGLQEEIKQQLAKFKEQRALLTASCFEDSTASKKATDRIPEGVSVIAHFHELVRKIGHETDPIVARQSLHDIIYLTEELLQGLTNRSEEPHPIGGEILHMGSLLLIQNMLDIAIRQVLPAIEKEAPGSLNRLYPVRLIEASLFQDSSSTVGGFSMLRTLKAAKNEDKAAQMLIEVGVAIESESQLMGVPLLRVGAKILDSSLKELWQKFIPLIVGKDSSIDAATKQELLDTIQEMEEAGILFEWANIALKNLKKESPVIVSARTDNVGIFLQRIKTLRRACQLTMGTVHTKAELIDNIRKGISAWESPAHIERNLGQLQRAFEFFSGKDGAISEFEQAYKGAQKAIERLALLNLARDAVRCFDEVIKTVKASTQFTSESERARAVYTLLKTYALMSERTLHLAQTQGISLMTSDSADFGSFAPEIVHEVARMACPKTEGVRAEGEDYGSIAGLDLPSLSGISLKEILAKDIPSGNAFIPSEVPTYFNPETLARCGVSSKDLPVHQGIRNLKSYLDFIHEGGIYVNDGKMSRSPGFERLNPERLTEGACSAAMLPSPDFNVQAAVLGNTSDYDLATIWPKTLEDYFTLFHQNMERIFNTLSGKNGLTTDILPEKISKLVDSAKLLIAPTLDRSAYIDAMSMEGSELKIEYNIPLRQHSARLNLYVDLSKNPPHFRLQGQFMGGEEHGRWRLTAAAIAAIGRDSEVISIPSLPSCSMTGPKNVTFNIDVRPDNTETMHGQLSAVFSFIGDLSKFSSDETDPGAYFEQVATLRRVFGLSTPTLENTSLPSSLFLYPSAIVKLASTEAGLPQAERMLKELEQYLRDHPDLNSVGMFDSTGKPDRKVDLIGLLSTRTSEITMHSFDQIVLLQKLLEGKKS